MKLYASDNSDLMEVSRITREQNTLVVEGTIMGSLPIRAVVKPAEVRRLFKVMPFRTLLFAITMLFRGSR